MAPGPSVAPPELAEVADAEGLKKAVETLGSEPSECLVCGSSSLARAFRKQGKWFWRCTACELVFVHDIYPEFVQALDELDYAEVAETQREPRPRHKAEINGFLDGFDEVRHTGRLLEVGCGAGLFLGEAIRRGWNCTGIELLPALVAIARERYPEAKILSDDLRALDLAAEGFDVVYMNEVIEHIVDPVGLMKEAWRILRPGGIALLRTGNARSWSARLQGQRWWYYHFGGHGHIRFYGPKSAQALADASGFAGVTVATRGFAFVEGIDLKGRWYRPFVRLSQSAISPLARPMGAGHRLAMRFVK